MSDRPLAVFDCDDTLNLLRYDVAALMLNVTGKHLPPENWNTYDWTELFKEPVDTLLHRLFSGQLLEQAEPDTEMTALARDMIDAGFDVEIWSARRWHPKGAEITARSMTRYDLRVSDIKLTNLSQPKGELITPERPPVIFVDDSATHCRSVAAISPSTLSCCIGRPWNRESPQRVENVAAIRHQLSQRGYQIPDSTTRPIVSMG